MALRTYKHTAREHTKVRVDRECSDCNHEWTAELDVFATGEETDMNRNHPQVWEKAKEKALRNLKTEVKKKKKDIDQMVLCPRCSHFSVAAMKKHFNKGYRAGILSKYNIGNRKNLIRAIGDVIASVLFIGIAVVVTAYAFKKEELKWLGWPVVLCILSVTAMRDSMKEFIKYRNTSKDKRKVSRMLASVSDQELLQLAIRCYHGNNNSLVPGEGWLSVLSSEASER